MSKITITFTEKQAFCLIMAASQVMDHWDAVENNFPERGKRRAAYNAYPSESILQLYNSLDE